MKVQIKTNLDSKKIMSELKKQTQKSLESSTYDIECPHCQKTFSARAGHNICPHCDRDVTLNLNINL